MAEIVKMEQRKSIVGFEGLYQVSENGFVVSMKRQRALRGGKTAKVAERVLKTGNSKGGYKTVTLSKDGKTTTLKLHRLVAEYFIPNPENKKTVNHKDGDKSNNAKSNLEWSTQSENHTHAYQTGLRVSTKGENHGRSKLTKDDVFEIRRLLSEGVKQTEIADKFKVRPMVISRIHRRETWNHI